MRYVETKTYSHTPSPPTAVLPLTQGKSAECPEWQHERSKCFLRNLRNPREIKTICEKDTCDTCDTLRQKTSVDLLKHKYAQIDKYFLLKNTHFKYFQYICPRNISIYYLNLIENSTTKGLSLRYPAYLDEASCPFFHYRQTNFYFFIHLIINHYEEDVLFLIALSCHDWPDSERSTERVEIDI